ncbi:MAG: hypothetical protein CL946_12565 [Ectothiorhodospiraceae bacterium]|nr:hypothetical protein [Ectothiorhodospiraceae bacterium]
MASPARICYTFIGSIAHDSRARRMLQSLSNEYNVHAVICLRSGEEDAGVEGIDIHPWRASGTDRFRSMVFKFWSEGRRIAESTKADVYIAGDLYTLPAAANAAQRTGGALVYDSRELYSALASLERRSLTQKFWNFIERRYARRAKAVLTVNHSIAEILRGTFRKTPVFVVHNYPDADNSTQPSGTADRQILRTRLNIPADRSVLISNGGIQAGRGAFIALDLVAALEDVHLVFLGSGPLEGELRFRAEADGLADRVHFLQMLSTEVVKFTAGADIGLCLVENRSMSYYLSLPNKLFEYLHAGLPVVGSNFPEIRRVIEENKLGTALEPTDGKALLRAVEKLLHDKPYHAICAQNAREAARKYTWATEEENLQELVRDVVEERNS